MLRAGGKPHALPRRHTGRVCPWRWQGLGTRAAPLEASRPPTSGVTETTHLGLEAPKTVIYRVGWRQHLGAAGDVLPCRSGCQRFSALTAVSPPGGLRLCPPHVLPRAREAAALPGFPSGGSVWTHRDVFGTGDGSGGRCQCEELPDDSHL